MNLQNTIKQDDALEQFVEDCTFHGIDPFVARTQGVKLAELAHMLNQSAAKPPSWFDEICAGRAR